MVAQNYLNPGAAKLQIKQDTSFQACKIIKTEG